MNSEIPQNIARTTGTVARESARTAWWVGKNVIWPVVRAQHQWLNQPVPRVSRRVAFVALLGTGVVGAAAHARYDADHSNRPVVNRPIEITGLENPFRYKPNFDQAAFDQAFPYVPKLEPQRPTSYAYADEQANEVAGEIGVHAGSFFWPDENVAKKLTTFYKTEKVLPIFPPEVLKWEDSVQKAVKADGRININVVFQLMLQETGGVMPKPHEVEVTDETTGQKKTYKIIGLFQVAEENFKGMKDIKGNPIVTLEQMEDPYNNAMAAFKVFGEQKAAAKAAHPDASEGTLLRLAAEGYNGGTKQAQAKSDSPDRKPEAIEYGLAFNSFEISAEVAARLQSRGLTDKQIWIKLFSKENEARLQVIRQLRTGLGEKLKGNAPKLFRLIAATSQKLADREIKTKLLILEGEEVQIEPVYKAALTNPNRETGKNYWITNSSLERCVASTCGHNYNSGWSNFNEQKWKDRFKGSKGEKEPDSKTSVASDVEQTPTINSPVLDSRYKSQLSPEYVNNSKYPNWGDPGDNCGPSSTANLITALGGDANPAAIKEDFVKREFGHKFIDTNGKEQVITIWDFANNQTYLRVGYDENGRPVGGVAEYLMRKGYDITVVTDRLQTRPGSPFRSAPVSLREFNTTSPRESRNIQRMVHLLNTGHKIISGGYQNTEGIEIPHIVVVDSIITDSNDSYLAVVIDPYNIARVKDSAARKRLMRLEDLGRDPMLAVKK